MGYYFSKSTSQNAQGVLRQVAIWPNRTTHLWVTQLAEGVGVVANLHGEMLHFFITRLDNFDLVKIEQTPALQPIDSQRAVLLTLSLRPDSIQNGNDMVNPLQKLPALATNPAAVKAQIRLPCEMNLVSLTARQTVRA
jgi:hypothetical protein